MEKKIRKLVVDYMARTYNEIKAKHQKIEHERIKKIECIINPAEKLKEFQKLEKLQDIYGKEETEIFEEFQKLENEVIKELEEHMRKFEEDNKISIIVEKLHNDIKNIKENESNSRKNKLIKELYKKFKKLQLKLNKENK